MFQEKYPCIPKSRIPGPRQFERLMPSSMAELWATINSLVRRMNAKEVKKSVNNVSKRAEACINVNGDNFEHLLKKALRAVEE